MPESVVQARPRQSFVYPPSGVYKPPSIGEQIGNFQRHFPHLRAGPIGATLTSTVAIVDQRSPANSENWVAMPLWDRISDEGPTSALSRGFSVLESIYRLGDGFAHYANGNICPSRIRQDERSARFMNSLVPPDSSDFVFFPAQFGARCPGALLREGAEQDELGPSEFFLGAYEIVMMLIANPKRLAKGASAICCLGTRFNSLGESDDGPCDVLGISSSIGGVVFTGTYNRALITDYSAPTGFVPDVHSR